MHVVALSLSLSLSCSSCLILCRPVHTVHIYTHTQTRAYMCLRKHLHVYVSIYIYAYTYTCTHTYIHTYIHTYTHTDICCENITTYLHICKNKHMYKGGHLSCVRMYTFVFASLPASFCIYLYLNKCYKDFVARPSEELYSRRCKTRSIRHHVKRPIIFPSCSTEVLDGLILGLGSARSFCFDGLGCRPGSPMVEPFLCAYDYVHWIQEPPIQLPARCKDRTPLAIAMRRHGPTGKVGAEATTVQTQVSKTSEQLGVVLIQSAARVCWQRP